jgi:hypothetical protein
MNPFDFVNSITHTKKDLMSTGLPLEEKAYTPFMVNRALGYFPDTVLFANIMNQYSGLDNKLQYDFLRHIVRKKKRFSKWNKPKSGEKHEIIKEYTGYSDVRVSEVIELFTDQDIKEMKEIMSQGGTKGKSR